MKTTQVIEECRRRMSSSDNGSDFVVTLHEMGLTISKAIKVVMQARGVTLREAKQIVTDHPAWSRVANASEHLHDEAEHMLSK